MEFWTNPIVISYHVWNIFKWKPVFFFLFILANWALIAVIHKCSARNKSAAVLKKNIFWLHSLISLGQSHTVLLWRLISVQPGPLIPLPWCYKPATLDGAPGRAFHTRILAPPWDLQLRLWAFPCQHRSPSTGSRPSSRSFLWRFDVSAGCQISTVTSSCTDGNSPSEHIHHLRPEMGSAQSILSHGSSTQGVQALSFGHTAPEALLNEPTERSTDVSTILCHWTNKGKKVHSSLLRIAGGVECHQQSPLLITCQAQLLQPSWEQESLSTWAHSSHKQGSFAMGSFAHRA